MYLSTTIRSLRIIFEQISCFRPETPGFYLRCLLIKREGHGQKLGKPRRLLGRERGTQRSRTARTSTS